MLIRRCSVAMLMASLGFALSAPSYCADPIATCSPRIGRIVSLQGKIEIRRAGTGPWLAVNQLDFPLCPGDILHTGTRSRSAVVLAPETLVRVDQNSTMLLRPEGAEIHVEMFKDDQIPPSVVGNSCGAGYFITRFPKKFKVYTPYLNAAVEGTEFQVALACDRAELSVFEGRVSAESLISQVARLVLTSGQVTSAGPGEEPAPIKALIRPTDAVQWALYYPPTSEVAAGDIPADCMGLAPTERSACLTARAEGLLRAGRVNEAQEQIKALTELVPLSPDAQALSSVIAVVKNDKAEALKLAQRAVELSEQSSRAWLALSYAQQAHFELEKALGAAKRAAALAPNSALIQARVAELLMSLGDTRAAEKAAKLAVQANPKESRAHTVLGFVRLAQIDTKQAKQDFTQAIELDSTDPLPRLGNGLAIIREGKLEEGREQIEIAVALDPTNSLIRSYVGKAYYEENSKERDTLAASQFEIAKTLDPKDPTPHFYDAILKQTQNRPIETLEELQASMQKNDNRAVNRSKLLLDQDRASRQVGLARATSEIRSDREAINTAALSVDEDPSNYSAHSFLSGAYAKRERYDISRSSELLQAQLLRPVSLNPVSPQLPYTDLSLPTVAQQGLFANDYSSMFERNRLQFSGGALAGNRDTWGTEVTLSGLSGPISGSLGYFAYSTDGFRRNSDISHEIYNAFVQLAVSTDLSLQAEYRQRNSEHGDISMSFDPDFFIPRNRSEVKQDSTRIGVTYRPSVRSTLLVALARSRNTFDDKFFEDGVFDGDLFFDDKANLYELQYQHVFANLNVLAGTGYSDVDTLTGLHLDFTPSFGVPCLPFLEPCNTRLQSVVRQWNGYLYANLSVIPRVLMTFGVSRDNYKDAPLEISTWNPKAGLRIALSKNVTVRAAGFRTLKRAFVTQQTIEPTQVAGFNQFYDDVVGSVNKTFAGALDLRITPILTGGIEVKRQDSSVSTGLVGSALTAVPPQDMRTESIQFDGNWQSAARVAVTAGAGLERFIWNTTIPNNEMPTYLRTIKTPIGIRVFPSEAIFVEATATAVWQRVERLPTAMTPVGSDRFAILDLGFGYRLPRRLGIVSVEARNIFDTKFFYQDDNFRSTELRMSPYLPVRRVFLKASLIF